LQRLAYLNGLSIFCSFITLKACFFPHASSTKGGCLDRAVLTAGFRSNTPAAFTAGLSSYERFSLKTTTNNKIPKTNLTKIKET